MRLRTAVVLALFASSLACNKEGEGEGDKPKDAKDSPDKEAKDDDGKAGDDGKPAGDGGGDGAGGSDEVPANAITECPKELKGNEKADRVIGKDCGTVKVVGNYGFDGGTLVIEGGVTLEFKDKVGIDIGYREAAKIIIKGTKDNPVTFTSGGDKAAGVWRSLHLYANASRSSITGLVLEHAGSKGAGLTVDAEDVTIKDSTFRSIKDAGVVNDKKGAFTEFTGNTFEDVGRVAVKVKAPMAGQIGEGNKFAADSGVFVVGGKLEADATWKAIGAPFTLLGDVQISGKDGAQATLTVEPGATLKFDGNAGIGVGYYAEGGFKAVGTADKPIVFTSDEKEEPGAWKGVIVHANGEAEVEHAQLKHGGKKESDGVFKIANKGRATITNTLFESNKVGLVMNGRDSKLETFDNNEFKTTPQAMVIDGKDFGSIGANNKYADDAKIDVNGGRMKGDFTWETQQGATVELVKNLSVDEGVLEIKAGFELHVNDGVTIDVGYYATGGLKLMGEADKPIKIVGTRDDAGTWKSIVFHKGAHGNELNHVLIRNAGGEGGLVFKRGSDGKVDTLTCEKCSGEAIKRDDNAKVEAKDVKAQ